MRPELWLMYAAAATLLCVTPGPNSLLALTSGAANGTRRALFTIAGSASGFALLIMVSVSGLGVLLATSERAYAAVRIAGALYLVWLGIRTWRSSPFEVPRPEGAGVTGVARIRRPGTRLFGEGLLVSFANPKVILFFAAFLPPFIDPGRPLVPQLAIMAATFLAIEAAVEILLAGSAARVLSWLRRERARKLFQRITGGAFVGAGVGLALSHG